MSDSKALIVRRSGLVKSVGSKIAITEKLLGKWDELLLGAECDRDAILLEESEVDHIQRKLAEIRESIPQGLAIQHFTISGLKIRSEISGIGI